MEDMDGNASNRDVLEELSAQHEELRQLLVACEQAADQAERTGSRAGRPMVRAATTLLEALSRHNREEERLLRPILLEADSFGEVRVSQMAEDHMAEHAAIISALRDIALIDEPAAAARALRPWLARLRQQLTTEERQFLNDRVVRDDVIAIDASDG